MLAFLGANIFATIGYILLAILVLLLMVTIHELGHYIVGRILKFKITEFSIGFGKAIFQKTNKRGEKISIRIFPLGGYCAFAGEDEDENGKLASDKIKDKVTKSKKSNNQISDSSETIVEKGEKIEEIRTAEQIIADADRKVQKRDYLTFNEQKPWKRILVMMAGATFNILSAIIFSFVLLVSYGYDVVKVNSVDLNAETTLVQNDIIRQVEGQNIDFVNNKSTVTLITSAVKDKEVGDTITLIIERDGQRLNATITIRAGETPDSKILGLTFATVPYGFFEALGRCFSFTFELAWLVLRTFGMLITGQIPLNQIGGPIATVSIISSYASQGFNYLLYLLPLIAVNLGVFNLLPFPALDGAKIVFLLIEWIRRKPISRKIEGYIHFFGLVALFAFIVLVDIIYMVS